MIISDSTTIHDLYDLTEVRLSHSTVDLLDSCGRKFELSRMMRMQATGLKEDTYAADAGHALHAGLQHYIEHGCEDEDAAIWAMMKAYDYTSIPDDGETRSIYACLATLEIMMQKAREAGWEIAYIQDKDGNMIPGVEVPFEIKLGEIDVAGRQVPIRYVGYIDLVVWDRQLNQYLSPDIKTTRRKTTDLESLYMFHPQTTPYQTVLEASLPGDFDSGNGLRVTYLHTYIDILQPWCETFSVVKDRSDLQDWYTGLVQTVLTLGHYLNLGWFPRNYKSCSSWNSRCQYLDICGKKDPKSLALSRSMWQSEIRNRGGSTKLKEFNAAISLTWEMPR